ncbi:ankyrin repeat and LEM domain-containing protein 2 [Prorops nasuta]|uniref:ankyrin repeat and LEM domain-containing protein 2 n=1 Tax=Prorops nasuta TaxID=863751 RepID=UPI0034CE65EA
MDKKEDNSSNEYNYVLLPNPKISDEIFHAIYIPEEEDTTGENNVTDILHVYLDKKEALNVIKEHKTGRLKTFKKQSEAEEFARTGCIQSQLNLITPQVILETPVMEEKSSNFKAPKFQELVGFRKLIENGDLKAVKNIVWQNPRYLIGSGDTPAILQEGCRYNALHIAVKSCKYDICELILNTISDTDFIKLHYGEEDCNNYLNRAQILQDLYLNTPDKGLNETPLHFASKFGHKEIVRLLVSYSQCIRTVKNKYDQLPIEIICSRRCQEDEELKKEIRILLEDKYYVPVLRSEDNSLQPVIGELFSPISPLKLNVDPISPRIEVKAFAGPMTKSQAIEFRKKWKTPPRNILTPAKKETLNNSIIAKSPIANLALRLQDAEKGLERVGRDLAEECDIPWKEYWPFLDCFVNLRSKDGMNKLEKYLENKFKEHTQLQMPKIGKEDTKKQLNMEFDDEIDKVCSGLQLLSIKAVDSEKDNDTSKLKESVIIDDFSDDEYFTPPSSPSYDDSEDEMNSADEDIICFIEGSTPTKVDYAVYNAVPLTIDYNIYPYVYRWRHEMRLLLKQDPNRFSRLNNIKRRLLLSP